MALGGDVIHTVVLTGCFLLVGSHTAGLFLLYSASDSSLYNLQLLNYAVSIYLILVLTVNNQCLYLHNLIQLYHIVAYT